MIVTCPDCGIRFDDEYRWTICPHNPLEAGPTSGYCQEHDLFTPCACCALPLSTQEQRPQPLEPEPETGSTPKEEL